MGDLTFRAYGGDACTLLAFDYPEAGRADLAGFAVWCTPPGGTEQPIENRLSCRPRGVWGDSRMREPEGSADSPRRSGWLVASVDPPGGDALGEGSGL